MKRPFASAQTDGHGNQAGIVSVPLTGRWLLLARLAWCATFFLSLAFLVMSIVGHRMDVVIALFLVAATSVWFVVSGMLFWCKSHGRVGVGMNSMRERAEELGGICLVQAVPMGGTRVLALLPYTRATNIDRRMGATRSVAPEEE